MSSDAEFREMRNDRLERQTKPARTAEMDSDQTTTDSYTLIDESTIQPEGRERLAYIVEETGGANAIDARVVKRVKDDAGGWSGWVPDGGSDAETTGLNGSSAKLEPADTRADEYGVEIKANTGGSQGDVDCKGVARSDI